MRRIAAAATSHHIRCSRALCGRAMCRRRMRRRPLEAFLLRPILSTILRRPRWARCRLRGPRARRKARPRRWHRRRRLRCRPRRLRQPRSLRWLLRRPRTATPPLHMLICSPRRAPNWLPVLPMATRRVQPLQHPPQRLCLAHPLQGRSLRRQRLLRRSGPVSLPSVSRAVASSVQALEHPLVQLMRSGGPKQHPRRRVRRPHSELRRRARRACSGSWALEAMPLRIQQTRRRR